MTEYLPPYDELCNLLGVDKHELQKPGSARVPNEVLLVLIKAVVGGLAIDVQFYRQSNPDVDKAFKNRPDSFVEKHFKETGYFEGRKFPTVVDVEYYKKRYSDLASAIDKGAISDLKMHFHEVGIFEKRVPRAEAEEEMKIWDQLVKTVGSRQSNIRTKATPQVRR